MIRSQMAQRIAGVVLLAACVGLLAYTWGYAADHGRIRRLLIVVPPLVGVLSLGMILFPMDMEKLKREHGVERVQSWSHLPLVLRGLVVLAGAATLANYLLVTGRLVG